jgi:hypothetical protein
MQQGVQGDAEVQGICVELWWKLLNVNCQQQQPACDFLWRPTGNACDVKTNIEGTLF